MSVGLLVTRYVRFMSYLQTANLVFERIIKGHLPVTKMAVSDSGEVMIAVPDRHRSRLYTLLNIKPDGDYDILREFSVERVWFIDFSKDGGFAVAATDDNVYVFNKDVKSRVFADRRENYIGLSISASGEYFALASADMILSNHSITLARIDGEQVWINDLPITITSLKISNDGGRILTAASEGLAILMDNSRNTLWEFDVQSPISAVDYSPSGDLSALAADDGAIWVLDSEGGMLWNAKRDMPMADCAISADGELVAAARTPTPDSGLLELHLQDGVIADEIEIPSNITSVACSANGRFAAVSRKDGALMVWEITPLPARTRSAEKVKILYNDGCAALETGDLESAIDLFAQALELSPVHLGACRKLSEAKNSLAERLLLQADEFSSSEQCLEAFETLKKAAELSPFEPEIISKMAGVRDRFIDGCFEKADALSRDEKPESALSKLQEIIEFDPANLRAREELARLEDTLIEKLFAQANQALESGEIERAVEILEEAAGMRSDSQILKALNQAKSRLAFEEGSRLYEEKKYSQAIFQFRKALNYDPENNEARKFIEYAESLGKEDILFDRFDKLE